MLLGRKINGMTTTESILWCASGDLMYAKLNSEIGPRFKTPDGATRPQYFKPVKQRTDQSTCREANGVGPILLTWVNLKSSMDKYLYAQ